MHSSNNRCRVCVLVWVQVYGVCLYCSASLRDYISVEGMYYIM